MAQSYTRLYYHDMTTKFKYTDAVVTEEFRWTPSTPYQGVVIFQPLQSTNASGMQVAKLQVTLTDNTPGASVVQSTTYELPNGPYDMIPIAAAYKSTGGNNGYYIVLGESRSYIGNTNRSTWYMLLDQDLKLVVPMTIQNFELLTAINPLSKYTFPTDVCPVYYDNGVDFAITGVVLDNSSDPDVSSSTAANRTMFIAKLNASTSNVVDWREYEFILAPVNYTRFTYPSRIVEIGNQNNPYPGYMVAGTTKDAAINKGTQAFYFRTDQGLNTTPLSFKTIDDDVLFSPTVSNFAVGDLYYDANTQEVYVAGTINYDQNSWERYYFFDKLPNITLGINVDSYADNWPGIGVSAVGVYRMPWNPLNGNPKIGRIGAPNPLVNDACVITSTLYENNPNGMWTPTMKLPHLMYVDYSSTALSNWTTSQSTLFDLYPRIFPGAGNAIPYHPAHSYDKPFYPNHTSFEFKPLFPKVYCLGGLSHDPPNPPSYTDNLLTLSVNYPINVNLCNTTQASAVAEMVTVSTLTNYTILQNQNQLAQGPISILMPWLATPSDLDCDSYSFKANAEVETSANRYTVHEQMLTIYSPQERGDVVHVYSLQGSLLYSAKIDHSTTDKDIDISALSAGTYLVKLQNSTKHEVFRFTKN